MIFALNDLIESRIASAQANGDFADLPGAGLPLDLREDLLVPEEIRVGNRVLKNAGLVPETVAALNALGRLRASLQDPTETEASRNSTRRRIAALMISLQGRGVGLASLVLAVSPQSAAVTK
ncbi:MAG: DUF1992 domain-containing protein [Burkholderiaceae bacterium]